MSDSVNWKYLLAVGIGGMFGAIGRYFLSIIIVTNELFPYATLTANLLGCFLLTYVMNHSILKQKISPEFFAGLTIGIIGSFTTFSTFSIETLELIQQSTTLALVYVVGSIFGGLLCCFIGYKFAIRK
ncbi:fluoride efflux transporter CrcB [Ornithinibacillus halophilus]|uniref:Fluoride-specific ion channel FluC n=1 Tax=Ornithinibacillus halophilus TaxID=930117 RepID=A0A1M5F6T5_9BACI|nr:fluoride efflux transporter CrcB [Ornithinibacillus halophilus]SHF87340.1 camphor resistance protein CrcB [Ornithinibacillus halophilus]